MSSESLLSQHEDDDEPSVGLLRNNMEARSDHQTAKLYKSFYSFTTSVGVGLLILVLFWILHYRGGFAWQAQPQQQFYWHPFLMVLGMVFLYGQSILVYRTGRSAPKRKLKIVHAALHCSAFVFAVVGLKAVFDSHNLPAKPTPNLYTLHSWIGLVTVIIFALQFLFGFISFLYPGLSKTYRQALLPVHTAAGAAGFAMAVATTMMGLTEKALWTLSTNYADFPSEGIVFNFIGTFVIFYGILVLCLVNETAYKRVALPEDEIALTGTD